MKAGAGAPHIQTQAGAGHDLKKIAVVEENIAGYVKGGIASNEHLAAKGGGEIISIAKHAAIIGAVVAPGGRRRGGGEGRLHIGETHVEIILHPAGLNPGHAGLVPGDAANRSVGSSGRRDPRPGQCMAPNIGITHVEHATGARYISLVARLGRIVRAIGALLRVPRIVAIGGHVVAVQVDRALNDQGAGERVLVLRGHLHRTGNIGATSRHRSVTSGNDCIGKRLRDRDLVIAIADRIAFYILAAGEHPARRLHVNDIIPAEMGQCFLDAGFDDGHGGVPNLGVHGQLVLVAGQGEVSGQRQTDDRGDANRYDQNAALPAWMVGRMEDHGSNVCG